MKTLKLQRATRYFGYILLAVIHYINRISDNRRAKRLIKRLYELPKENWLRIDHTLNRWEFPMEFFDLMPHWWLLKKDMDRQMAIISPVMHIVNEEFGRKEQLRYHNVFNGKMTNEEFEYWFNLNRNDIDIHTYYDRKHKVKTLNWWQDDIFQKLSDAAVF